CATRPRGSIMTAGSAAELVGSVERRDFVALRQRWIVEDSLEEVVESTAEAEHGLPDVHELGRAGAETVDGEEPAVLAVEEHLEEPAAVAQDLTPRDLAVSSDAGLVRHPRGGQLVLRRAHHRDLRDRVDADREVACHRSRLDPECLTRGQATLLRRGGGETWIADHVSGGEDVRHRSAEGLVHLDPAAGFDLETGGGQIEALRRGES